MKILKSYLLKEFFYSFTFGLLLFNFIFLISEFFFRLPIFISQKASFFFIVAYLLFHIPLWIRDTLPIAILVGIMFSLNRFSRDNEITAIKSSGINLHNFLMPLVVVSAIFVFTGIFLNYSIVPRVYEITAKMREAQLLHKLELKPRYYTNLIYYTSTGQLMTIELYGREEKCMWNITIDTFDRNYSLAGQTKAQRMQYTDNNWLLYDVIERKFSEGGRELISEERSPGKILFISDKPEDFIPSKESLDEMTIPELAKEIAKLKKSGQSAVQESVEYNMRLAYPFANLVVIFIGIPLALGLSGKFVKLKGVGYVLLLAFLYWSLMSFGRVLGDTQFMPAFICTWFGNITFLTAGSILYSKIQR